MLPRSRCAKRSAPNNLCLRCWFALGASWFLLFASAVALADKNPPRINYMLHCQGCHLPGGIGHPGLVPSMQGHVGRFLESEAGRAYLVQVPGAAQSDLNDGELAEVINWLLPEFDPVRVGVDFKPFTADEVSRYRQTQLLNISEVRRRLLASPPLGQ